MTPTFQLPDGRIAGIFILSSADGHELQITNLGGILHRWRIPDMEGNKADILVGCPGWSDYAGNHPYFGALVGRYANRIGNARFTLGGRPVLLTANMPPHHLHGGALGFDKKIWAAEWPYNDNHTSLRLTTTSADGEEGYPGNLTVTVTYTLLSGGFLCIEYEAVSDQDTYINLTSHPYFNLSGGQEPDVLSHEVQIHADAVTETDKDIIPTGRFRPVDGTPLDFREPVLIGKRLKDNDVSMQIARGYDHNYILNSHSWDEPVATVRHHASGRQLRVYTDQPGVQLYTGNWLEGVHGLHGMCRAHAGFCLETQHFPDSPNHPHFPSTLLKKGEKWTSRTCYRVDCL